MDGLSDDEDSDQDDQPHSDDHRTPSPPSSPHPSTTSRRPLHPLQSFSLFSPTSSRPSPPPHPHPLATSPSTLSFIHHLHHLALTSLGPHSSPKLIHLNPSSPYVTLTTTSTRLFSPHSNLPLSHPLSLLLSPSLTSQPTTDGGLLTLTLTLRLISHLSTFPSLPPALLSHAHTLTITPLLTSLTASSTPLTPTLPSLLPLLSSLLHSKPSPPSPPTTTLSLTLLHTLVHSITTPHLIRYLTHITGPTPSLTQRAGTTTTWYPGVVLDVEGREKGGGERGG